MLTVKQLPDEVHSHDLPKESIFCHVSTEAHLAQEPEPIPITPLTLLSMIEALSVLGPSDTAARDAGSCIFYDSKHAAGVCLGTIRARTLVQLGLSCQRLLLKVQLGQRFTMQHVYSHAENLGNECADHAAALGAFGLVSNHNLSSRWARQSFDSVSCFDICHNLGDDLEKLRDIGTARVSASQHQTRSWRFVPRCATLCFSCLYHRPLGYSSFICLAQFHTVSVIEGCVVQRKGQMPCLFLPLRALPTSFSITFGIP